MKKAELEAKIKESEKIINNITEKLEEMKLQRDTFTIFYEHCVHIVNNWINQPPEERCFLLRKNMLLLLDYIFKFMTEKFKPDIDINKDTYNVFMKGWADKLDNAQVELKKEFEEKQAKEQTSYYT